MLYVFYGNDYSRVRLAAQDAMATIRERSPKVSVYTTVADQYEPGRWADLASGVSLFAEPNIYLIDQPSQSAEGFAELRRDAGLLGESTHHFIIIEGPLLAADRKLLAAAAVTCVEYKAESREQFNSFALADALTRRDKRTLWLLLQESIRAGMATEETIGILWWQLKTLRLSAITKNASEAGIKDFPYNKAKRSLANFKTGEIETLARSLLMLYHEGHSGKRDLALALESWVLRL